jgi:hypothetical protein
MSGHRSLMMIMVWVWVQMRGKLLGSGLGLRLKTQVFDSLESSMGPNPSVIDNYKVKILEWAQGNLAARVHGPPHSNGPP